MKDEYVWSRRRDLNSQPSVSKTDASFQLGYIGKTKAKFEKTFYFLLFTSESWLRGKDSNLHRLGQSQASCRLDDPEMNLVSHARFERATSTFARLRSVSIELMAHKHCRLPIVFGGDDRTRTYTRFLAAI